MWRLGVESILGLSYEQGQLRVDPCIPAEWPGFEAKIRVRGEELHVVVENPHHVTHGVAKLTRQGRQIRVTLGVAADAAE